jgi:predicted neutral ceramidase superfamily lipid hydrolase
MLKKSLLKDKRGVFGLTAVQAFFAIILGVALLAYVIVIIMGTLQEATILSQLAGTEANETYTATMGYGINATGYTLTKASLAGFGSPVITEVINWTNGSAMPTSIVAVTSAGVINGSGSATLNNASISYTYTYNSVQQNQLGHILGNTSTGITGFFSSINPIYAILAILVIILVLVVLVRVVQAPRQQQTPQL